MGKKGKNLPKRQIAKHHLTADACSVHESGNIRSGKKGEGQRDGSSLCDVDGATNANNNALAQLGIWMVWPVQADYDYTPSGAQTCFYTDTG